MLLSSDTPELVHLCDRVAVMRDGAIVAMIERGALSEEAIVAAAMGAEPRGRRREPGHSARQFERALLAGSGAAQSRRSAAVRRRRRVSRALWLSVSRPLQRRRHIAKFTQSWFPLALVAMAQAILMLDRRHQPGDRRDRQPRRRHRRDDDDRRRSASPAASPSARWPASASARSPASSSCGCACRRSW